MDRGEEFKINMRKLLILLVVLIYQISFAQEILVKGLVLEDETMPYGLAQIINLRTNNRVSSGHMGKYSISAKIGDTLKFMAYEKFEQCYAPSYRIVFNKEDLDVELMRFSNLEKKTCKSNKQELLVFIGKFETIEHIWNNDECFIRMYSEANASYEVIQEIYGNYDFEKDNIQFNIAEHFPVDSFISDKHKYALLFVKKYCDNKYYLITHRDIYKTKNKRWALRYNLYNSWYFNNMDAIQTKASNIKFRNASLFIRKNRMKDVNKFLLPSFYKQRGRKFIPLKGFYVEDYFKLWKSSQKEWNYDN